DRKDAARERGDALEAARVNRAGKTVRGELDAADGLVEPRHEHAAARLRRGHEEAVVAPRVRSADGRARPAAEAVRLDPLQRGGAFVREHAWLSLCYWMPDPSVLVVEDDDTIRQ